MVLPNKVYDVLRILQDFIPIVGTFAATILAAYGADEAVITAVAGTSTAITVALTSFLRISKKKYEMVLRAR